MNSKTAITRLKVVLLIDLLIVAAASGTYLFLQSQGAFVTLKPSLFIVTDLSVDPTETAPGQPIAISVNVTNIGEETGSYLVSLIINGVAKENSTVTLSGGEHEIVEFIVMENIAGTYLIEVGERTGTFTISSSPPPSTMKIADLKVTPYEGWVNESIKASFKVSNSGTESLSYALPVRVDNFVIEFISINLSPGETGSFESDFAMSEEGNYSLVVGGVTRPFKIVPTGKHTLMINTIGEIPFTMNGEEFLTPYSELLDIGKYTITFPEKVDFPRATYLFIGYGDGVWSTTKTIDLQEYTLVIAIYSYTRSCPSLLVWNGNMYVYRAEVSSGTGYLGIPNYFRENGNWSSLSFLYSNPWDYVKLDNSQIKPRNGYFEMTLDQAWDEISYVDSARLIVIDHSKSTDVFSTMGTYLYCLEEQGTIYTVSDYPSTPVSAFSIFENGTKKDVLSQISNMDSLFTESEGDFHWKTLELNLGDLSQAKTINLVVAGKTIYSSGQAQGEWAMQFVDRASTMPFPPPFMEVKDANGMWVRVPDNRQFPLVDVTNDEFVVNLTGLFPTRDYSLRINSFFDVLYDYIGVDTTSQEPIVTRSILPARAELRQIASTDSISSGNFTRYGVVTELVKNSDDMFVIGRQGDRLVLQFDATKIPEVPAGMERDYFFVASLWFKVDGLPYFSFTVEPLPFQNMSAFPYYSPESYPCDVAHQRYISEYNTRVVLPP